MQLQFRHSRMSGFNINDFTKNADGSYSKAKTNLQPREKKGKKPHVEVQNDIYNTLNKDSTEDCLIFEWCDKHVSLNEWYSSKHWSNRNKIKNEWHKFYKSFLIAPYPKFDKYRIELDYNSRLDPSNTIPMIKLLEDALVENGVIINDTKEYCKGLNIVPNLSLKNKSYRIKIIHIKCEIMP